MAARAKKARSRASREVIPVGRRVDCAAEGAVKIQMALKSSCFSKKDQLIVTMVLKMSLGYELGLVFASSVISATCYSDIPLKENALGTILERCTNYDVPRVF